MRQVSGLHCVWLWQLPRLSGQTEVWRAQQDQTSLLSEEMSGLALATDSIICLFYAKSRWCDNSSEGTSFSFLPLSPTTSLSHRERIFKLKWHLSRALNLAFSTAFESKFWEETVSCVALGTKVPGQCWTQQKFIMYCKNKLIPIILAISVELRRWPDLENSRTWRTAREKSTKTNVWSPTEISRPSQSQSAAMTFSRCRQSQEPPSRSASQSQWAKKPLKRPGDSGRWSQWVWWPGTRGICVASTTPGVSWSQNRPSPTTSTSAPFAKRSSGQYEACLTMTLRST